MWALLWTLRSIRIIDLINCVTLVKHISQFVLIQKDQDLGHQQTPLECLKLISRDCCFSRFLSPLRCHTDNPLYPLPITSCLATAAPWNGPIWTMMATW